MPDLSKKYLSKAKLAMGNGNELVLVFDDFMAAGYFNQPIERKQLEDAITEQIGKEVTVSVKEKDANEPFEDTQIDLEKVIHMEITYEE